MSKYTFRPYDPKFKKLYLKERSNLRKIFSKETKVEHIGSTAVPGLGGKGIIDIAIFTSKNKIQNYISLLEKVGFEYQPHPGDDKRKFMQKIIRYNGKERRIHLHLTFDKEFWKSFIAFRDYLKENKKAREKYSQIKKEAVKYARKDGKKYFEHKKLFLKKIARKAMARV